MRWDAFVSYSRDDLTLVSQIAADLEDRGLAVWSDMGQIRGGSDLVGRISEGLRESRYFIPFLSTSYLDSRYCAAELSAAIAIDIEKGLTIVPVRVDDSESPALLASKHWCDFRNSYLAGWEQLCDALGVAVLFTEFRVSQENAQIRVMPQRRWASFDFERRFEVTGKLAGTRELVIFSNQPPQGLRLDMGEAEVRSPTGFFEVHSRYPEPLAPGVSYKQRIYYELHGVYGDDSDFWFYTIPSSYSQCNVSVLLPGTAQAFSVTLERDSVHAPLADVQVDSTPEGHRYSITLRPEHRHYRLARFEWTY